MAEQNTPDVNDADIRSSKLVTYLPAILVSAAFTAIIIHYSFRFGRLRIYPLFDDSWYLADALRRIDHVYATSPMVFFADWIKNPPHSPYSSLLAFVAFLTLGIHDWAPYVANVFLVLAFVLFSDRIMAGTLALCRWSAMVLVLSTPVTGMAVHEFRPDIACALLTTMAMVAVLGTRLTARAETYPAVGGIFFGLALLAKPSVFPLTIIVLLWAMFAAMVREALLEPTQFAPRAALRRAGVFVLIAMVLAAPHYLVGARSIAGYIYTVQIGSQADVYTMQAPFWQQALYYLSGPPARTMLGYHCFLMLAVFVLWALTLWFAGTRESMANTVAYSSAILVAYLGVTLNWQKSEFLGLAFQMSLVFFTVLILRGMVDLEKGRGWRMPWARVMIVTTAIAGLMLFRWPAFLPQKDTARAEDIKRIDDGIMDAIVSSSGSAPATIAVTTTGRALNVSLFNYFAMKRRLPYDFEYLAAAGKMEEQRAAWPSADFVIVGEPGNSESFKLQHSYGIQEQLIAALRARPDFAAIASIPTLNGKRIFIFQHIGRTPQR